MERKKWRKKYRPSSTLGGKRERVSDLETGFLILTGSLAQGIIKTNGPEHQVESLAEDFHDTGSVLLRRAAGRQLSFAALLAGSPSKHGVTGQIRKHAVKKGN